MNNTKTTPQGIIWSKKKQKWQVMFQVNRKTIWGGYFADLEDAKKKLNELMLFYNKSFAAPRGTATKKRVKGPRKIALKGEDPYFSSWYPPDKIPELDAEVASVFIDHFVYKVGWETEITIANLTSTINAWSQRHSLGAVNEEMVAKVLSDKFGKWLGIKLKL